MRRIKRRYTRRTTDILAQGVRPPAQRRCLRCERWFRSCGAHHRRCDGCRQDLRYQSVEAIAC